MSQEGTSLIGEVKNKESRKFSKQDAIDFENKAQELIKLEKVERAVLFIFSLAGFTKDAVEYMKSKKIAFSKDKRWFEKT